MSAELKRELDALGARAPIDQARPIALDPRLLIVDARRLQRLTETDGADFVADLAALQSGPFLDGLHVEDDSFEEWARIMRADIDFTIVSLARRLEQAHENREASLAVRAAEQLVALDPVREDSHRLLLTVLAHHRGRDAALVRAQALARLLRSELDAEPEAETRELIENIRRVHAAAAARREPQAAGARRSRPKKVRRRSPRRIASIDRRFCPSRI